MKRAFLVKTEALVCSFDKVTKKTKSFENFTFNRLRESVSFVFFRAKLRIYLLSVVRISDFREGVAIWPTFRIHAPKMLPGLHASHTLLLSP